MSIRWDDGEQEPNKKITNISHEQPGWCLSYTLVLSGDREEETRETRRDDRDGGPAEDPRGGDGQRALHQLKQ